MYSLLLLVSTTCLCASALSKSIVYYATEKADFYFEEFISKYDKQYPDDNEKGTRFEIFKNNLKKINCMNEQSDHAEYGITKFMDLTPEEFVAKHTGLVTDAQGLGSYCGVKTDKDIPDHGATDSFDWRDKNAVTPVKDQGNCASSYAFSLIGHAESQYFLVKKENLTEFSEQHIIDCDESSDGCQGGLISSAAGINMKNNSRAALIIQLASKKFCEQNICNQNAFKDGDVLMQDGNTTPDKENVYFEDSAAAE